MGFLTDVVNWFRDQANWRGDSGVVNRLIEHVEMSLAAVLVALVLALPIAVWLGHKRRFGTVAINVSNVGRALPSFAILVVGSQLLSTELYPFIGTLTAFIALVALAIPPIVTNTYVGVSEVPDDIRESAQGMGLSDRQSLFQIELPVAVPLIMAGIRTSAVQVVATATIAAQVGAGGLGRFIIDGFAVQDYVEVFAGALLVGLLALITELGLSALQRAVTAKGLRGEERAGPVDATINATIEAT